MPHRPRESNLALAGKMLAVEILGCMALGASLEYFGYDGDVALATVLFTNLWVAWLLYRAARTQRRSHAYVYGIVSILGPVAALAPYLVLRLLERAGSSVPPDAA